MIYEEREWLCI